MKSPPEDGSLREITSSGLIQEINVIIIRRPDEIKKPGETTYTFATFDRTKEGEEWPGDQVLEKLIPGLPKVKSPEVSKPEVTVKKNTLLRNNVRKKFNQKFVQKDNNFTATHRPKPSSKKFRSERSGNPSLAKNIDPWIHNPWENRGFFSGVNTVKPLNATSLTSEVLFNSFQSQHFPPRTTSNNYNFPNNSTYERNMTHIIEPNTPFLNNHISVPDNRIPNLPLPSFSPPITYTQPSNRRFCEPYPTPDVNFNGVTKSVGLLGKSPVARCNVKQGLLGDRPFPSLPYTTTFLPREEEKISDKNNFVSNAKNSSMPVNSYDASYGRIMRPNFDNYTDVNEISMRDSHDSYKRQHPNSADDSRNESFRDTCEANYNRFLNSGNSANNYENQYRNNYEHLDHNYPNGNDKNISLKNPRNSYNSTYREFKKPSVGVSQYDIGYMEVGNDNSCKNNYNESQISCVQEIPSINNQGQNPMEETFIHVNDSAVSYSQENFQNEGYPVSAANSTPRSNLNLVERSNKHNFYNKNANKIKRPLNYAYKYSNNRMNGVKNNRGRRRFKNWRTSQK